MTSPRTSPRTPSPRTTSPRTRKRLALKDTEMTVMHRIFRDLALLDPNARARVLDYVVSRRDKLPVIAAVGGGTDEQGQADGAGMFDEVTAATV